MRDKNLKTILLNPEKNYLFFQLKVIFLEFFPEFWF